MNSQIIELVITPRTVELIAKRKALYSGAHESMDTAQWESEVHEVNRSLACEMECGFDYHLKHGRFS